VDHVSRRQILAFGGGGPTPAGDSALVDHFLALTGAESPRVCMIGTAMGDSDAYAAAFYRAMLRRGARPSELRLFHRDDAHPRELLLAQDAVWVNGGNTANLLAIWRVHGVDDALREAWERGIVLGGSSAGMICWFEASITDSFGPALAPLRDGLGFLPGSACPHYDGEARRRPVYRAAVADGLPAGYAADDQVALHFDGTELREAVTSRAGSAAYRVEAGGEERIEPRVLQ
jgi:dipeptidase E